MPVPTYFTDALADCAKPVQAERLTAQLRERRNNLDGAMRLLIADVERRGLQALPADEQRAFDDARDMKLRLNERIAELEENEAQTAAAAELRVSLGLVGDQRASVTEPDLYSRNGQHSFVRDLFVWQAMGDHVAGERLQRHQAAHGGGGGIESRAITTGTVGGFAPPTYLAEQFVALARAGRPFANVVRSAPLPGEGMSFIIPRVTGGTSTAVQATQNTNVSNTDVVESDLTVPVVTVAGQQDVSRQTIERASAATDQMLIEDLAKAYATALNVQCVSGSGSSGQAKGVLTATGTNAVTYTDASPTLAELYPKVASAISQVQLAVFEGPTHILMTPLRWAWCLAQLDSQSRPFIVPTAGFNSLGTMTDSGYGKVVGTMLGLPVVTDASIPSNLGAGTNEDRILVVAAPELWLFEEQNGAPRSLRFEETSGGSLTTKLVTYGYFGFTAERRGGATSIIAGTGLVQPTL